MEISFTQLRTKEVINTQDGRRLGRVSDVVLCYPDNRWIGLVVPGGRGFSRRQELFLELKQIVKIGEDVILVNVGFPRSQKSDKRGHGTPISPPPPPNYGAQGRNFEEFE